MGIKCVGINVYVHIGNAPSGTWLCLICILKPFLRGCSEIRRMARDCAGCDSFGAATLQSLTVATAKAVIDLASGAGVAGQKQASRSPSLSIATVRYNRMNLYWATRRKCAVGLARGLCPKRSESAPLIVVRLSGGQECSGPIVPAAAAPAQRACG